MKCIAYIDEVHAVLRKLPDDAIRGVMDALWQTYQRNGVIYVCGNGGSASTSEHFVCDLMKATRSTGMRKVRAWSLTSTPLLTAYANDDGYQTVYVKQLESLIDPMDILNKRVSDCLVVISGSGNSPNVVNAIEWAKRNGLTTIGLTGFGGGKVAAMAQHSVIVPCHSMPQVEDVHLMLCHAFATELGWRMEESRYALAQARFQDEGAAC